jgi:EAL domain-containing protein (putative c-di-GMP-specific phosphodiesterase class I)
VDKCQTFSVSPDVGREGYLEFVHPDDRPETIAEASKIASGFPTVHFRNRYRCKDGTYKWLAWTASAALVDGAIYASARDITTQVLAHEEQTRSALQQQQAEARVRHVLAEGGPRIVFQPVFTLSSGVLEGYEALSRFEGAPQRSPDLWFADAAAAGLSTELELCAIDKALALAAQLPQQTFVSVNLSPSTVSADRTSASVAAIPPDRLVLEITEHAAVADYAVLKESLRSLRRRGIRLAIDDAGAGYSGLNHIIELVPEFIKLDLFLTRGIESDAVKRALAAALVSFARQVGACLIAEGVETAAELGVLEELGIQCAQGFYLGQPLPLPARS